MGSLASRSKCRIKLLLSLVENCSNPIHVLMLRGVYPMLVVCPDRFEPIGAAHVVETVVFFSDMCQVPITDV